MLINGLFIIFNHKKRQDQEAGGQAGAQAGVSGE
jgi:hypothetical protein